ncbi:hypothetical protein ABH939_005856 [Rhodococcus sp. 27YEA6]
MNLAQHRQVEWSGIERRSLMPTPSKGDRTRVSTRVPKAVDDVLERRWRGAGASSKSQFLADLLAIYAGHEELVVELKQEVLPLTA